MVAFLILAAVGAAVVILGRSIMKGNIEVIHSYHRQRVAEEHKAIFGRRMGAGTIFCGAGIVLFGILFAAAEITAQPGLMTIGSWLTAVSLAVGIGIMIHTTKKYNQGIF